jgi:hypothetical protein
MLQERPVRGLATRHLQGDAVELHWGYALMLTYRESERKRGASGMIPVFRPGIH